jgi:hypothetical protein
MVHSRCEGLTFRGTRCKRSAARGRYCQQHQTRIHTHLPAATKRAASKAKAIIYPENKTSWVSSAIFATHPQTGLSLIVIPAGTVIYSARNRRDDIKTAKWFGSFETALWYAIDSEVCFNRRVIPYQVKRDLVMINMNRNVDFEKVRAVLAPLKEMYGFRDIIRYAVEPTRYSHIVIDDQLLSLVCQRTQFDGFAITDQVTGKHEQKWPDEIAVCNPKQVLKPITGTSYYHANSSKGNITVKSGNKRTLIPISTIKGHATFYGRCTIDE